MLNISRIQLELEKAKEKLRTVEETIQKVEGKTFSNGPVRYGGLKVELHSDQGRNPMVAEDGKGQRRRVISSSIDLRAQRLGSDDASFNLKRGPRDKREPAVPFKRQSGPQGVFARLSGLSFQQPDDEEEEDFSKKPALPSRVFTTTSEAPSRQEVIAAQAIDEQSKQRNKRMFGALVGTLQKFRKEETRVREREEKRLKVEKKLEEDAKREREQLLQEKRELFLEKKRREIEIKRIEWSLNRVKEYEAWEANVLPLKNFIQTQAKPHIFYLPGTHNEKTQERLALSQKLVNRMIDKRKNNLKEEIENSEKKARKSAVEEVEEEEAENIPENNNEALNSDQQMNVDFGSENPENGFHENEGKLQDENTNNLNKNKDSEEEENWDNFVREELKETVEDLGNVNNLSSNNVEESKEPPITENEYVGNELTYNEERPVDVCNVGENELGNNGDGVGEEKDEKLCESEQTKEKEVNYDLNSCTEHISESSDPNANLLISKEKAETVEKNIVSDVKEADLSKVKSIDKDLEKSEYQSPNKKMCESDPEIEGKVEKNIEKPARKSKDRETSRRRDRSRNRKATRHSRSPRRKSRSPRRSRSNRRRSSSRRRRPIRRSRSISPSKKSRRSRSPISRRRQRRNSLSKKRSPLSKCRRSSSSVSPRKRRSLSTNSSKSY